MPSAEGEEVKTVAKREGAPPALFDHCSRVYEKMLEQAHPHGESDILVYEGFLTRLVADLNLSVPYFTATRKQLIKMGCIRQLKRGGGTSPSQWELIYEPTLEQFNANEDKTPKGTTRFDTLDDRTTALEEHVGKLQGQVSDIIDVLAENFGKERTAQQ